MFPEKATYGQYRGWPFCTSLRRRYRNPFTIARHRIPRGRFFSTSMCQSRMFRPKMRPNQRTWVISIFHETNHLAVLDGPPRVGNLRFAAILAKWPMSGPGQIYCPLNEAMVEFCLRIITSSITGEFPPRLDSLLSIRDRPQAHFRYKILQRKGSVYDGILEDAGWDWPLITLMKLRILRWPIALFRGPIGPFNFS